MQNEISKHLDNAFQEDTERFAKILDSSLKVRIMILLIIYPELSLTQLSKKLKKVKSTISKHMNELIKLGLAKEREQDVGASLKQKLYSSTSKYGYWSRTDKDLINKSPTEVLRYLKEEYNLKLRSFSFIKEITEHVLSYVNDYYLNLKIEHIDNNFVKNLHNCSRCVPRLNFFTKEDYIQYQKEFLKFEKEFIKKIETKYLNNPQNIAKEYLVIDQFLPIREILDHVVKKK
ncbi:MAG: ArsR family transcriptional regulator [Candidatus Lokiarchaeota archaeon]|nr:ArsR family transcriptional regulator [Candidatus Lokiarchaeota archaeon]